VVYKKYIKKNGRLHGPYYYESYRENGRVKHRYLGTSLPKKSRVTVHFLVVIISILLVFGLVLSGLGENFVGSVKSIAGKVVDGISKAAEASGGSSGGGSQGEGGGGGPPEDKGPPEDVGSPEELPEQVPDVAKETDNKHPKNTH